MRLEPLEATCLASGLEVPTPREEALQARFVAAASGALAGIGCTRAFRACAPPREHLAAPGRDEAALERARAALSAGGFGSNAGDTHARVLLRLLRLGHRDEAFAHHRCGYSRVAANPRHLPARGLEGRASDLAPRFERTARALGERLDHRNGNTHASRELERWLALARRPNLSAAGPRRTTSRGSRRE